MYVCLRACLRSCSPFDAAALSLLSPVFRIAQLTSLWEGVRSAAFFDANCSDEALLDTLRPCLGGRSACAMLRLSPRVYRYKLLAASDPLLDDLAAIRFKMECSRTTA